MNDDLEGMLIAACPSLFNSNTISISGGDGWFDLIMDCSVRLEALNQTLPEDQRFTVAQIKEKFGGLRYYLDYKAEYQNDEAYAIIAEAERRADNTCSRCGSTKNVSTRGERWIYTMCDSCSDESLPERAR